MVHGAWSIEPEAVANFVKQIRNTIESRSGGELQAGFFLKFEIGKLKLGAVLLTDHRTGLAVVV